MVGKYSTRTLILTTGLLLSLHVDSEAITEGTEGFGQVEDCRFLTYEQQQFFDLKLPSFRTDWISPDFIQGALPHTPAKDAASEISHIFNHALLLDPEMQQLSISNTGSRARLDRALQKLREGKPVGVGISGGSITIGTGTKIFNEDGFFGRIVSWINATYPHPDHTFVNGGMGGSTSGYMAQCIERYLPSLSDMDIIFLEFDLQDPYVPLIPLDNPVRRGYEQMLRKLLSQPQAPAVVEIHFWAPNSPHVPPGSSKGVSFYHNSQAELDTLAAYYRVPALSLRNAIYDKTFQGLPGFRPGDFMCDAIHPNFLGHRYLADLAISLMQDRLARLVLTDPAEDRFEDPEMLPPMFLGNDAGKSHCMTGSDFQGRVLQHEGWEWINEGKNGRQKWGFVTTTPGNFMEILIDTTGGPHASKVGTHPTHTSVEVWHHLAVRSIKAASCSQSHACKSN
ncbi:hypothetical protein WJX84_001496 [Apatococcus fuscideae]|uniref:SGNH hydrolase-type esterase domain-containing protein n=1 Tax=Apatococcus fuscideae TaxID=2026836 RepID=A0AAW1SWP4_9CHLO